MWFPCHYIFRLCLCHLCSLVQWLQMMWMQAITLIKSHARFYCGTLEAAGCRPSVLSWGLERAALLLKPCVCVSFCQGWVQFTFNSVFADACARCLRGRGEEIDGERWCCMLWYESPHQPQIHCLLLASNTIRHRRHQFLKGCNAHLQLIFRGGG